MSNEVGDFIVKKHKNWKGNLSLIENRLGQNLMWCAMDNHNFMRHIMLKKF